MIKKINFLYLFICASLFLTTSCSEDDGPAPATTVGVSFESATATIDRNATSKETAVVINVDAPLTKAELESRLKLAFASATAVQNTDYRIKSTTVTENPLKATVVIEALPTAAKTVQEIVISFDASMQPITPGTNPTLTLRILPFAPARTWANPSSPFYAPKVRQILADGTVDNINAGHFSVLDPNDASILGFVNNNVSESGVNLFNMVQIYMAEIGSNTIKTAKINSPKTLQFTPTPLGSRKGTVSVIPQDVVITRRNLSTFKIGISGQGTYDEDSGEIDLVVDFNETAIGGPAKISRTYKIIK